MKTADTLPLAGKRARLYLVQPGQERPMPDKYRRRARLPLIRQLSTWDVDDILDAQDAHERGEFITSGLLALWMLRTSRLKAVMRKRAGALTSLSRTIEPNDPKTAPPEAKAICKIIEREWKVICPPALIRGLIRQMVLMGWALCRVHWEVRGRYLWPILTLWANDAVYYSDTDGKWYARTREGGNVKITPGCGWLLWLPEGERSFQMGSVLSLSIPCLLTTYSDRDWANFNKSHADVIKKCYVPRGATRTQKDDFLDDVEALDRDSTAILLEQNNDKSGFNLELESPGNTEVDTFERSQMNAEKKITIEVLGQEKSTDDGGVGTYDAIESMVGVENKIVMEDGEGLSDVFHDQLLVQVCALNWDRPDLAPWVRWKQGGTVDPKKQGEGDKALAEGTVAVDEALKGTGKRLDKVKHLEKMGYSLMDEVATSQATPAPSSPSTPQA